MKLPIIIILLLCCLNLDAAESSLIKTSKKNSSDDQLIAALFCERAEELPMKVAYQVFTDLSANTQSLIRDHAAKHKLYSIYILTINPDIFTALIERTIPNLEPVSKVRVDDRYGQEYASYDEQGYAQEGGNRNLVPTVELPVYLDQAKKDFLNLTVKKAFSIIRRYNDQNIFKTDDYIEDASDMKSSINIGFFTWDDAIQKEYRLSLADLIQISPEQQDLLYQIAAGHKAGLFDKSKRYQMTKDNIALLKPLQDWIDKNLFFRALQIGIACEPYSTIEKCKDILTLAIPLLSVSILPDVLSNQIPNLCVYYLRIPVNKEDYQFFFPSKLSFGCYMYYADLLKNLPRTLINNTPRVALSWATGFTVGKWIYPHINRFSSSVSRINQWFGKNNRTPVEKRWSFGAIAAFHCLIGQLGYWLMQSQNQLFFVGGVALQAWRVAAYFSGLFHRKNFARTGFCAYFVYPFTNPFVLKKHNDPISHRNKDDKSFTLIDVLNGPIKTDIVIS